MGAPIFRFLGLLALLAALSSCSRDAPDADARSSPERQRAAVDALDRETANSRADRVSNIHYDLYVDIASAETEFTGRVVIAFDLADASADLTIDFTGGSVEALAVNSAPTGFDYNGYFITVPGGSLAAGTNEMIIDYRRAFVRDGSGLHRFVDPEDDLTYLYSYLWPYYANRLLPSFDQPNLKAEFSLQVLAPENWTVVSMSPGESQPASDGKALWAFATTPPISTYVFSLHAGPYATWEHMAGDVPLRLMARQSLAEFVAVEEWLEITRRGMTFFENYFESPYPFAKYDQLLVPEFNIGGMENAAAVTYGEHLVQRQPSDRGERERRAGTVLHELAHMWFGDLVTHDWWNGMWLNESFATQMASLAKADVTEFDDAWHGYFTNSKSQAYYADSRVTTHPIEMPIRTTAEFHTVFDDITYEKGGSVLKQLGHLVGADNYRRGIASYMDEFAWGTTTLDDFIRHQEKVTGLDLGPWSEDWLLRSGFNTLAVASRCDGAELQSLVVTQSAPADYPFLRTHKVDIGLYMEVSGGALVAEHVIPATIEGASTEITIPPGTPCPLLVNPNHNDWAYAQILLSDSDLAVLAERLADIEDPFGRSIFIQALADRAMLGEMSIAEFTRQAMDVADGESNPRVLEQTLGLIRQSFDRMERLRPETREPLDRLLPAVEEMALRNAHFATTEDLKLLWFNLFLDVVSSYAGLGTTAALFDGRAQIDGIEMSPDRRWRLLLILSKTGAVTPEQLEDQAELDSSDYGQRQLLAVQAAVPELQAKSRWLDELQDSQSVTSLAKRRAVMGALFPATQTELQAELLDQILEAIPELSGGDLYFLRHYMTRLLTPMCRLETAEKLQGALDAYGAALDPTILRFLREAHQADAECAALRSMQ
jgi:aminopeptidase N